MPQFPPQDPRPHPPALPAADAPLPPSKTQRDRDAHALQALGGQLVALSAAQLAQLDLPETLHEAVVAAQRMRRTGRGHGICSLSARSCGSSSPTCSATSARHWCPGGLGHHGPSRRSSRHRAHGHASTPSRVFSHVLQQIGEPCLVLDTCGGHVASSSPQHNR